MCTLSHIDGWNEANIITKFTMVIQYILDLTQHLLGGGDCPVSMHL